MGGKKDVCLENNIIKISKVRCGYRYNGTKKNLQKNIISHRKTSLLTKL